MAADSGSGSEMLDYTDSEEERKREEERAVFYLSGKGVVPRVPEAISFSRLTDCLRND